MVKELTAKESFDKAFKHMRKKLNGKEVVLSESPQAEIANDSDWHRERVGYFIYKKVMTAVIDGKECVIALGTASGDYPADPYGCDIVAFRISLDGKSEKEVKELICKKLIEGSYFKNSVVIAMDDGRTTINPKGPFTEFIRETAHEWTPAEYTAKPVEYHEGVLTLDCRRAVKSSKRYTEQFPAHLSDMVCAAIAASI
ncbi:MAG: hypothetical protein WC437_05220 [Patescibacteria group bacterium]